MGLDFKKNECEIDEQGQLRDTLFNEFKQITDFQVRVLEKEGNLDKQDNTAQSLVICLVGLEAEFRSRVENNKLQNTKMVAFSTSLFLVGKE